MAQGRAWGLTGLWGSHEPEVVLEPEQGSGVASLPLFLPPARGPQGQSGSNRRFLPCRKGCLARHKPPDKGASIAQTVPIWACPHPRSPSLVPHRRDPRPRSPGRPFPARCQLLSGCRSWFP